MEYFELKKQRAKEQSKTWWFEAVLTDEEANIRTVHTCMSCKKWDGKPGHCKEGHLVLMPGNTVCDEWRYFA